MHHFFSVWGGACPQTHGGCISTPPILYMYNYPPMFEHGFTPCGRL